MAFFWAHTEYDFKYGKQMHELYVEPRSKFDEASLVSANSSFRTRKLEACKLQYISKTGIFVGDLIDSITTKKKTEDASTRWD